MNFIDLNSGTTQAPVVGRLTQRLMAAFIPCQSSATIQFDSKSRTTSPASSPAEHDKLFEEELQKVLVDNGFLDANIPLVCCLYFLLSVMIDLFSYL